MCSHLSCHPRHLLVRHLVNQGSCQTRQELHRHPWKQTLICKKRVALNSFCASTPPLDIRWRFIGHVSFIIIILSFFSLLLVFSRSIADISVPVLVTVRLRDEIKHKYSYTLRLQNIAREQDRRTHWQHKMLVWPRNYTRNREFNVIFRFLLREELSFKPSLYYCGMQMRRIALFIRLYGLNTFKIKEFCWLDNVDVNISD